MQHDRILRCSYAALTGLLALALALPAAARPHCGQLDLAVLRVEAAPTQYRDFCALDPEACAMVGEPVLDWTDELNALSSRINAEVNAEIELVPDEDNLGREEVWSLPVNCRGDCEDFALEKRRRLTDAGVPRAALTMAIVFHKMQFYSHAVLLLETTRGTWVLDNLHDDLMCWDALPYRYTHRERPDGHWTRFENR